MKMLFNGGLNVSVLDGWWAEAWSTGSRACRARRL
jgi:glucan phosphorylase